MKRVFLLVAAAVLSLVVTSCSKYRYEEVVDDPLHSRIYTLDNGLKVYMTVNGEAPRIQTYIAVRVGSKNDPLETTGLAHYFEHLMFKGTESFGTQDYEAERPMLDEIERLFEVYRTTTDADERRAIYARIDSVSQEASKLAIPNEYDKLMSAIGAAGTNAFTSYDMTVYTEEIPSNQIDNWAKIQSDRFANAVIRGFHTELETVYEEYNMSLTSDSRKMLDSLMVALYPHHPYGMHTVLGTQEDLKNPSITNIKNYYKTYYVPNNMAICLSGDFDPDRMIATIDKYFGGLKPNPELPEWSFTPEPAMTAPVEKTVLGQEAEMIYLGWRTGGASSEDADMIQLVSSLLSNGKCGLLDVDIQQQQKMLGVGAEDLQLADYGMMVAIGYPKRTGGASSEDADMIQLVSSLLSNGKCGLLDVDIQQQQKMLGVGAEDLQLADYGMMVAIGYPKPGQTLEEARDMLLDEIGKLRAGDFDEELLASTIANYKRGEMQALEENGNRAMAYVDAFINGVDWKRSVEELDRLSKVTKADVVAWANEKLDPEVYAAVYKRQGVDPNIHKIDKPQITPIATNRDKSSEFLAAIQAAEVEAVQPVFVDYASDLSVGKMKQDIEVLYKQNTTNGLFSLYYVYDFGTTTDPAFGIASDYFDLLGTDTQSLQEIQREFYDLACSFGIHAGGERIYVTISGLAENMDKAVKLAEEYMQNVEGDDAVLAQLKANAMKARNDAKLNQNANFRALQQYTFYGPEAIRARTLTDEQLMALTSDELLARIRSLSDYEHYVMYYGPETEAKLIAALDAIHRTSQELKPVRKVRFPLLTVDKSEVNVAQYDAKQIYYLQYSNRGEKFSTDNDPGETLFNSYFGGGMNAVVFQEMREARSLAYTAFATFTEMRDKDDPYIFYAFIATQNDKMRQAVEAFDEIIENMPESEKAFELAKQGILANLSTQRTVRDNVLWSFVSAREMGVGVDRNKAVYDAVQGMTLADVKAFHDKWVKGRKYTYSILGDRNDIDMDYLRTLGPVHEVSQRELFGY